MLMKHYLFQHHSKSLTYSPSSCELSKMRMCVLMFRSFKLVHVYGVHCHMCAFSTSDRAFVSLQRC